MLQLDTKKSDAASEALLPKSGRGKPKIWRTVRTIALYVWRLGAQLSTLSKHFPVSLFSPHTYIFLKSPHQPLDTVLLLSSSHSSSCKRGVARTVMALSSPLYLRCCHFLKLLKVLLCVEPVADPALLPACSARALPSLGLGHLLHCQHLQASFWAWKSITSVSA